MNSNGSPFKCVDPEGSWILDQSDEPPQDRLYLADDFPGDPGDARIEQQERDWERDEAEAAENKHWSDA